MSIQYTHGAGIRTHNLQNLSLITNRPGLTLFERILLVYIFFHQIDVPVGRLVEHPHDSKQIIEFDKKQKSR